MELNFHVCGFDPRKLKAGCDSLRVRILTEVHSWLEDLVRGFVGVMLGEIFSSILLGEGPFKMLESIRVEEVVRVVGFVWCVEWQMPGRGGGGGFGGGLHLGRQ
jgi:hypothetical protein